jgi:hypothetical protein
MLGYASYNRMTKCGSCCSKCVLFSRFHWWTEVATESPSFNSSTSSELSGYRAGALHTQLRHSLVSVSVLAFFFLETVWKRNMSSSVASRCEFHDVCALECIVWRGLVIFRRCEHVILLDRLGTKQMSVCSVKELTAPLVSCRRTGLLDKAENFVPGIFVIQSN